MSDLYFPNKSTVPIVAVEKLHMEVGKAKKAHLLKVFELVHTILHTLDGIWALGELHGTPDWGDSSTGHSKVLQT